MELPLWYRVSQRQLSFREFEDRFNDSLFQEREVIPIFVLAAFYGHDPYVDGVHILQRRIGSPPVTDRVVRLLYLYWVMRNSFKDDFLLSGNSHAGSFSQIKVTLPSDFDDDYIYNWISILLRSFFTLGPLQKSQDPYRPGNFSQLTAGLNYNEMFSIEPFDMKERTVNKAYRLSVAHSLLIEIKAFFRGEGFPSILKPYRRNRRFFESVVDWYWPVLLQGLQKEAPFEEWEIEIINKAHQKLYTSGDFEFYCFYADKISQLFGESHEILASLQAHLDSSPENDSRKICSQLSRLDPYERKRYFMQKLMITDRQLENFVATVRASSFNEAIQPYLAANKRRIDQEIALTGSPLSNNCTLETQTDIYLYNLDDLVFYSDGKSVYVFLHEELTRLKERQNPYNRQPIPSSVFDGLREKETESFEELWQKILRRKIDFSPL